MNNPKIATASLALALVCLVFIVVWECSPAVLEARPLVQTHAFADDAFEQTWERTDNPIEVGQAVRTWVWGPPITMGQREHYAESKEGDGKRLVQYFEKSRMEINHPDEPEPTVTNGLLVTEMITGKIQIGAAGGGTFVDHRPCNEAIAGDPAHEGNEAAPTYHSFASVLEKAPQRGAGTVITETISKDGSTGQNLFLARHKVALSDHYDGETGHNIPQVFMEFFKGRGPVFDEGGLVNGQILAGWKHFSVGRPISEPYWVQVKLNKQDTSVLVQVFERRVLTYVPDNPEGWKVEMGNVGKHYLRWRYTDPPFSDQDVFPTPTPTTADLVVEHLEVTQAIQDLHNSVRLVAGKKTFVRFHVHSDSGEHTATAILRVWRDDGTETDLLPIDSGGYVTIRPNPYRMYLEHSFLFELPTDYTEAGTTYLEATVNPEQDRRVYDTDPTNDVISTRVSFETVPDLQLSLYEIGYGTAANPVYPKEEHVDKFVNWLERVYPIRKVQLKRQKEYFESIPSPQDILTRLEQIRQEQPLSGARRYYGMVDDEELGHTGGIALEGSYTAVGTTGTAMGKYEWDTDNIYGDWMGARSLARTYGLKTENPEYPHNLRSIGPIYNKLDAIYGLDVDTLQVCTPVACKDLIMGDEKLEYLWISDYTYHYLMDCFQGESPCGTEAFSTPPAQSFHQSLGMGNYALVSYRPQQPQTEGAEKDHLLVIGTIDPEQPEGEQVELRPLFSMPRVAAEPPPDDRDGGYAIVLRDGREDVLARYRFDPQALDNGIQLISEWVPYEEGTVYVDIEEDNKWFGEDKRLKRVSAGPAFPTVEIITPNGGEVLSGSTISVSWEAADPDPDDVLFFKVQYSPDNGKTWEMTTQSITTTSTFVDAFNVVGSDEGLFRVLVSDGIHTSSDVSDAPVVVPNHLPTVEIVHPSQPLMIARGQTVGFEGRAYDSDIGTMDDDQLTWTSHQSGVLGQGSRLSVDTNDWPSGSHIISFTADDGMGGVATEVITIVVEERLADLPPNTGSIPGPGGITPLPPITETSTAEEILPPPSTPTPGPGPSYSQFWWGGALIALGLLLLLAWLGWWLFGRGSGGQHHDGGEPPPYVPPRESPRPTPRPAPGRPVNPSGEVTHRDEHTSGTGGSGSITKD